MTEAAITLIVHDWDAGLIAACRALDSLVYAEKYLTEESAERLQIKANPRSRVVATHQGVVVGYIEYIPLTVEGFELFLSTTDRVFDLLIEPGLVSPWRTDQRVDVYIASMVVHPDWQSKGISMVLLQGLLRALQSLEADGYLLGRIGGTAVSVPGRRFLDTMLGLPLAHAVPGGVTGIGETQEVIRHLAAYLDW